MTRRRALMLMVFCLLVAAILRLPSLTETPPGLHYDEAANGILAGDIGLRGERPVFIPSYTGKEPLFFYLGGGLMYLLGESTFALRLTAAYLGLLTIAATYWLGRELLADRRTALIAAALLAVSFWHLVFSRLGFRAISQPLLQALAVAFLFRGLKRSQLLPCLVGGLLLGLSAYTYLAVRLFPLPLVLAMAPLLMNRSRLRLRLTQLGLFVLSALIVSLPLLLYFFAHPDSFWVRVNQVGPDINSPDLLRSYARSLGMLFLVGDPYWRFNIPGRALFNWFWGGLLVVGWLILLLRWRRWWYDWQKASVILLLLAPIFMILPTALAVNEIVPSNLRAIGLIPFIFYLPAVGLIYLLEQVANLIRRPDLRVTRWLQTARLMYAYDINYSFVILAILFVGAIIVAQTYFGSWGTRSDLYYDSDADLTLVADFIDEQTLDDGTIYVAALHYRHPTLAFLSERYDDVKWLPESQALVFPEVGPALYVYPHNSPPSEWATPYLADPLAGPSGPDGSPTFLAYELAVVPNITVSHVTDSAFGNQVTLLGYDLEPTASGDALPLTLHWRVEEPPADPLLLFVHLEDENGYRWSQVESSAYPAEQWLPGDRVIQRVDVPTPTGAPPGQYRLRVGFFDPKTGARLPRLDDEGRHAGDSLLIEPVTVTPGAPPSSLPIPPRSSFTEVNPGLVFLGYERGDFMLGQGEDLDLALWWQATKPQPAMLIRLEMVDQDGTGKILLDTVPVGGTYPFDAWQTPQFVIDRIDPQIPPSYPPGRYTLTLHLLNKNAEVMFSTNLGLVSVEETKRDFDLPTVAHSLGATLGETISLVGYDLSETANNQHRLSLIWQALGQTSDDYTVFVHLLHPDGTCCLWQADNAPIQGSYPTSGWLPDEVITDSYDIVIPEDAPPGVYPLEVGLYLAETGQRLVVRIPDAPDGDAITLDPIVIRR